MRAVVVNLIDVDSGDVMGMGLLVGLVISYGEIVVTMMMCWWQKFGETYVYISYVNKGTSDGYEWASYVLAG